MSDLFPGQTVKNPEFVLVKKLTYSVLLNHFSMTKCAPNELSKLANT